jgi:type IV secretion system protein VirB10
MAEQAGATAPVTDHRPVPRGVLPRGFQTWLMAGLAVGIVIIIFVAGEPEPPPGPAPATAVPPPPNPDRLREYQQRLRAMEARAVQEMQAATPDRSIEPAYVEPSSAPAEDPIAADRRRRNYESLFASNVVLSRRPEPDRPDAGRRPIAAETALTGEEAEPSLDEIADAVVRATTRASGPPAAPRLSAAGPLQASETSGSAADRAERTARPNRTGPISAAGPLHRVLEGTLIDTALMNRLDGASAAPVNCLVTNPVYSHSGQHVLIPAGARLLGETRPVQALGETRLAVAFHRIVMPDGRTHSLDQFLGLNQIGDAGLRDQVKHHYWSTFRAAGAVGLISGLAQWLGTGGFAGGSGDRTVIIAGSTADATSQASLHVMSRFLNRLPTVTIREGHRVKVYLTGDLELPAYEGPGPLPRF